MPLFNDILRPLDGARVLASYTDSYYKGTAALIEKKTGKGRALHFGSTFSRTNMETLLRYAGVLAPFDDLLTAPKEVEIVQRTKNGSRYLFVLNYMQTAQKINLKEEMLLLYDGTRHKGEVTLQPFETAVYKVL